MKKKLKKKKKKLLDEMTISQKKHTHTQHRNLMPSITQDFEEIIRFQAK